MGGASIRSLVSFDRRSRGRPDGGSCGCRSRCPRARRCRIVSFAARHLLADLEEGADDVLFAEDVDEGVGVGAGAVVEGEGDDVAVARAVGDESGAAAGAADDPDRAQSEEAAVVRRQAGPGSLALGRLAAALPSALASGSGAAAGRRDPAAGRAPASRLGRLTSAAGQMRRTVAPWPSSGRDPTARGAAGLPPGRAPWRRGRRPGAKEKQRYLDRGRFGWGEAVEVGERDRAGRSPPRAAGVCRPGRGGVDQVSRGARRVGALAAAGPCGGREHRAQKSAEMHRILRERRISGAAGDRFE